MIVRELLTRLSFTTNEAQLRKYETGVNNIKNSAEGAANSFRNMFAAFVGFSAAQSLARTADEMMSLEARVGLLPQTVGDVGDAFDTVGRSANAARQPLKEYISLYTKIGHATKEYLGTQQEVIGITDTIAKGLIVGGASAQESTSVMMQLSQALGSGTLQGEEFRAMAEGAPQMLDALAVAMGHPRAELKKLASEGKLTTKDLILAFQKISEDVNKRFMQMPMTIGQATTIIYNRWAMFINKLNRKSGTVTSIAKFLLDGFDKVEKKLGELVDWLGGAKQAMKLFGIVAAAALAPFIAGAAVAAFGALANPITWIVAGLILLGLVLEDVYQYFTGGESIIGDWITEINNGNEAMKALGAVVIGILAGITLRLLATAATSVIVWAINAASAVASWGIAAAASVTATVTMVAGFVKIAAMALWTGARIAMAWLIGLGPIGLIIAAVIAVIAIFIYFKDEIIKWVGEAWDSITAGFFAMIDKIKKAWSNFKSFFSSGVNANVSATTVAGAASSAGGTGGAPLGGQVVNINQTLPPGSTPETAAAAKGATMDAMKATDNGQLARQMGQAQ